MLEVDGLVKHFPGRRGFGRAAGPVRAVDGVSFVLHRGETLAVVGESGCGKSTLAQVLMRLEPASAGAVRFHGADVLALRGAALRAFRRSVQLVLQDPYSSLDPRMTAGRIVGEPFAIHRVPDRGGAEVAGLLERVGLDPAHVDRYPHQFSGGQRQRIGIARALALRPQVLVCDEPVSALDVPVQAQVLDLLGALQRDLGLSYVFIAHDLAVVAQLADRVAVMYLGRIVETGPVAQVYVAPAHPYTRALLSAVPVPDPALRGRRARIRLTGEMPSPFDPPTGCRFRTRCPAATGRCATEEPALVARPATAHAVACHHPGG
ncbi:MAG: ABC transporter ATP-binding protein [Pseudonocardia sp.]